MKILIYCFGNAINWSLAEKGGNHTGLKKLETCAKCVGE